MIKANIERNYAGETTQGAHVIAIGEKQDKPNQAPNSIVLNELLENKPDSMVDRNARLLFRIQSQQLVK